MVLTPYQLWSLLNLTPESGWVLPPYDGGIDAPGDLYFLLGIYAFDWPVPVTVPSDDDIANALAGRYGTVTYGIRALWYSPDLVFRQDISSAFLGGSINLNNDRQVLRTAWFRINPKLLPSAFDPVSDLVKLELTVDVPRVFSTPVFFPLGVFSLDEPKEEYTSGETIWDVDASDLGIKLLDTNLGASYTAAAGTNYIEFIEDLLDEMGLQHALDPSPHTIPVAFTWPWQTYRATVCRQLLEGINYFYLWPDENGVFRTRRRIDPDLEYVAVEYRTDVEPRMIVEPWRKTSLYSGPTFNRAVLVIEDPAREPVAVEAVNISPTSPISTANGIVKTKSDFEADRSPDIPTMIETAAYHVRSMAASVRTATLETFLDPRRGAHETYTVTISGIESSTKWRVASWTMMLQPPWSMTHLLQFVEPVAITTAEIDPELTE